MLLTDYSASCQGQPQPMEARNVFSVRLKNDAQSYWRRIRNSRTAWDLFIGMGVNGRKCAICC
ncbi:MAG: hypothetical protein K7J15_01405, partial [Candidatus Regiella insecticola]|nr:hypothetical protein [Candidatus Regiella insecticola]